jgi:hypothetical protein
MKQRQRALTGEWAPATDRLRQAQIAALIIPVAIADFGFAMSGSMVLGRATTSSAGLR